eukprot:1973113-Pleurochrysis_carterae.AAC.1
MLSHNPHTRCAAASLDEHIAQATPRALLARPSFPPETVLALAQKVPFLPPQKRRSRSCPL